jgi:hypothetical protein
MPRTRITYSGRARGTVVNPGAYRLTTDIHLDNTQTLDVIRHLSEALSYQKGVLLRAHYGRRRLGTTPSHLIEIRTDN